MTRRVTPEDISAILDRIEVAPSLGPLLRANSSLRPTLERMGLESAKTLGAPRAEIERFLRATLRRYRAPH
jgi:hypothetical protein